MKTDYRWSLKELNEKLTKTSASRNTHFSNCVKFQQCSLVNVMPSSGRLRTAKFAASFESSTFTVCTRSNTSARRVCIDSVTPGVMSTASLCCVSTRFNELATTKAPSEYESFVASVTHAKPVVGVKVLKLFLAKTFCSYNDTKARSRSD